MSYQDLNESADAKLVALESIIEMSPDEAELAGAFVEDALSKDDAIDAIAQGASDE